MAALASYGACLHRTNQIRPKLPLLSAFVFSSARCVAGERFFCFFCKHSLSREISVKAEQVTTKSLVKVRSVRAWKQALRYACIGFACLSLYACAIAPSEGPGMSSDVLDGVHKEGIRPPFGASSHFRKQTKGKIAAVSGAMTAWSIASAVLGGGFAASLGPIGPIGPRNHAPADGYTVTENRSTVFTIANFPHIPMRKRR